MRYLTLLLFCVACTEPAEDEPDTSTPPKSDMTDMKVDMPKEEDMPTKMDMTEPCDQAAKAREALKVQSAPSTGMFEVTMENGITTATLDASLGGRMAAATKSALYLDLSKGELVAISDEDALKNSTWTLGFKRTEIRLNSADSGPGTNYVARVNDTTWEDAMPPRAGTPDWRTDDFVSDTCEVKSLGPGLLDTAIGQWYNYDPTTHAISVIDGTVFFFYNAGTHALVKFEIQSYDSGVYTLRWGPYSPGGR